jgi:DNA-binding NarL/FixJ family response regulator
MVTAGIVSSRKLIRSALCALLHTLPVDGGVSIVLDLDSIADSSEQVIDSKPQVLIIDCGCIPAPFDCVRTVRALSPSTRCLLLSDDAGMEFAAEAARIGAWGVVTERCDPVMMQRAIGKVASGEMWFSDGTLAAVVQTIVRHESPQNSAIEALTSREVEVIALLAQGYQNKEIAQRLILSVNTVRTYTETIYRKLGINSRLQAALWYRKQAYKPFQNPPEHLETRGVATTNDLLTKSDGKVLMKTKGLTPGTIPSPQDIAHSAK